MSQGQLLLSWPWSPWQQDDGLRLMDYQELSFYFYGGEASREVTKHELESRGGWWKPHAPEEVVTPKGKAAHYRISGPRGSSLLVLLLCWWGTEDKSKIRPPRGLGM